MSEWEVNAVVALGVIPGPRLLISVDRVLISVDRAAQKGDRISRDRGPAPEAAALKLNQRGNSGEASKPATGPLIYHNRRREGRVPSTHALS